MKYIKSVPSVLVNEDFAIVSVRAFEEDREKIVLDIVEHVPQFVRGYVCDMKFSFCLLADNEDDDFVENVCISVKDLVLVYIDKNVNVAEVPEFRYVFYK